MQFGWTGHWVTARVHGQENLFQCGDLLHFSVKPAEALPNGTLWMRRRARSCRLMKEESPKPKTLESSRSMEGSERIQGLVYGSHATVLYGDLEPGPGAKPLAGQEVETASLGSVRANRNPSPFTVHSSTPTTNKRFHFFRECESP